MTYNMIVRADDGGLGNQTAEIARHLPPQRALIVSFGARSRGVERIERYAHVPEVRVTTGQPSDDDLDWVTDGPAVFTAECGYREDWCEVAAAKGCRSVLQANPELYAGDRADRIVVPTDWERERLGSPPVLPLPVARDRLPVREAPTGGITTWFHPAAPAMLDRNGTRILTKALARCRAPITVISRGHGRPDHRVHKVGRATIVELAPVANYWEAYPEEAQAMVLPRRYGGLSMSMQEAASLGWPIVSLDLEPQRQWLAPEALVPVQGFDEVPMRGGRFRVANTDGRALAALLDRLYEDGDLVARMRDRSLRQAELLDWGRWVGVYEATITGTDQAAA